MEIFIYCCVITWYLSSTPKHLYVGIKTETRRKRFQSCQKNGLKKFNIFLIFSVAINNWNIFSWVTIAHWREVESCGVVGDLEMKWHSRTESWWLFTASGTEAESNIEFYDLWQYFFALFEQTLITILMSQYFTERTKNILNDRTIYIFLLFFCTDKKPNHKNTFETFRGWRTRF